MAFVRRCLEFFPLEYMAEMATAGSAGDLYAGHEQRLVLVSINGSWDGVEESRPSTTTRELCAALVEWGSTTSARINPLFLVVFVLSRAGAFRSLLAQDPKLLRGQDCPPLRL